MEVGDISSWVAATVAVGGAGIAFWQGKSARQQAQIARDALEDARRARDEAATPVFRVDGAHWVWGSVGERFVTPTITMEQGPPLSEIILRIGGPDVRGFASDTGSHDWDGQEKRFTSVVPGKQMDLVVQMEHEGPSQFELELTVECTEEGGHARSWIIRRMITASETPQSESGRLPSWPRRTR